MNALLLALLAGATWQLTLGSAVVAGRAHRRSQLR